MTQPDSKGIVNKLLSLPEDQNDIKFQNLAAVMNSKPGALWDVLELYRAFYPPGVEQKGSQDTHPTVADTANSLSDQIARYQTTFNGIYQAVAANGEASRGISQIYNDASKDERLKHKLFLTRMCEQANELHQSLKSVLTEMEQTDRKNRKYQKQATICGLPQEIWFNILNQLPTQDLQLCEPFIKATCYSLHVIMRELKDSQSWYSHHSSQIMYQAAELGQLGYVKFLHGVGRKLRPDIMVKAAESGNLELVKYIHEHGGIIDWPTARAAARSGDSQLVSYTLEHVTGVASSDLFAIDCLKGGNVEVIKNALDDSILTFGLAEQNGEIICTHYNAKDIIQMLIESGAPVEKWKSNIEWTWYAVHGPNAECLKYLTQQGFEVVEQCAGVPYVLECVHHLFYEHGLTNPDLIENAAKAGKLDVLKFGYEVCNYPLSSKALVSTIDSSYACFEYLVNNNCAIDAKELWQAVGNRGDERHVKLLLAKKAEFDPIFFACALPYINREKNKTLVTWVAQQGVPLGDNICDIAASSGNFELLTYAHSQGKPLSSDTVIHASKSNSVQCLEYALDHGAVPTAEAMYTSYVACLALLLDRGCPIPYDIEMFFGYSEATEAGNYYSEWMKRAKK